MPDTPNQLKVLVVDDFEEIREFLYDVLVDEGYHVSQAVNGKDALRHIRRAEVDLIITDLVMPEQEGIETIRIVHAEYPQCKIIAISEAGRGPWLKMAGLLGAHATLSKPFTAAQIIASVQDVTGKPAMSSSV